MLGSITEELFLSLHWRRKPLLVKGGAWGIVAHPYTDDAFAKAADALSASGASGIHTRAGEVTFIENLSRADPALHQIALRYASLFGLPTAWFDGVQTYGASGIGAHFDHSDNFVLQQSGVKSWTLAAPDTLPQNDLARRMYNVPGVGSANISDDQRLEFELHPGDVLYIPLFWAHRGVSHGPSLSLSLVCPAVPAHASLLGALREAMRERLIGHQPMPSLSVLAAPSERERHRAKLKATAQILLQQLSKDDVLDRLVDLQMQQRVDARE